MVIKIFKSINYDTIELMEIAINSYMEGKNYVTISSSAVLNPSNSNIEIVTTVVTA